MGPGDLSEVLSALPSSTDPRLLVGRETFDDAGVYLLSDDVALVQTVDFFAPIVDDPYDFGQVAAANALSDVYAMGGQPLTALNIVAFPSGTLPFSVLTEILRGGQDKVHEAGAHIAGGHSIIDPELKYGLSVTGRAHPAFLLTNANARAGDVLILTKPIGTGILSTALKRASSGDEEMAAIVTDDVARAMVGTMKKLNGEASRAALAVSSRCATDITGFGLLGHASHIARASSVTLRIHSSAVKLLDGAKDAWLAGATNDGLKRNQSFLEPLVDWKTDDTTMRSLLCDPQTSGGLLVAVPRERASDYLSRVDESFQIGEVAAAETAAIVVD
ncbi:MAG TPA: selenide, water dikinase SelD [Gemmatimonadaceae bacterium]|nr:selenide, water dikinase SelD [Gemmatimonadaceae bacterium]